jgi:hypothetical protein
MLPWILEKASKIVDSRPQVLISIFIYEQLKLTFSIPQISASEFLTCLRLVKQTKKKIFIPFKLWIELLQLK